jgi:hypothetical protein
MKLFAWLPKFFSNRIDTPSNYDYGASACGNRVAWCSGLGSDTIVSSNIDGTKKWKPFYIPGMLVADPSIIWLDGRWIVFHTLGFADGTRNAVSYYTVSSSGVASSNKVLIPHSTTIGTYGNGQPSCIVLENGFLMLWYRVDGDFNKAIILDRSLNYVKSVPFVYTADGASCDIFWWKGKVWQAVTGGGWFGVRSYRYENDRLVREIESEKGFPVPGGYFNAILAIRVDGAVDGAGVRKNLDGTVFVKNNSIEVWQGCEDRGLGLGSWFLKRFFFLLP